MPLFLIGFMGAGKTTLGHALEGRLPGWRYIDLDEEVERRAGMSVADIFSTHGEEHFRRMERQALADLSTTEAHTIIGCGGGTPCFFDNMELMNSLGPTILLQASRQRLLRRLVEAQSQRPKLKGMSAEEIGRFIDESLSARERWYSMASDAFPSDLLENRQEVEETCRLFINRFISHPRHTEKRHQQ